MVWGNSTQSAMRQTTILQKRAIRLINNAKYNSHTEPLFRRSHLMKITDIFEYQAALFVFDFKINKLPVSFNYVFTFNRNMSHSCVTRNLIAYMWHKLIMYLLKSYLYSTFHECGING